MEYYLSDLVKSSESAQYIEPMYFYWSVQTILWSIRVTSKPATPYITINIYWNVIMFVAFSMYTSVVIFHSYIYNVKL